MSTNRTIQGDQVPSWDTLREDAPFLTGLLAGLRDVQRGRYRGSLMSLCGESANAIDRLLRESAAIEAALRAHPGPNGSTHFEAWIPGHHTSIRLAVVTDAPQERSGE